MLEDGVEIRKNVTPKSFKTNDEGLVLVSLSDGQEICVDQVLVATGRTPNVEGLGLENSGIKFSQEGIEVNDTF